MAVNIPSSPGNSSYDNTANLDELKTQLGSLQKSINQLEFQLSSLIRERNLVQSQINRQFNVNIPIARLPVEIMSRIFNFSLYQQPKYVLCLLFVCRRWYEIVMADRGLWTDIRIDSDYSETDTLFERIMAFVDTFYERSGSHSLDITLDTSGFHNSDWSRRTNKDIDEVAPDLLRISAQVFAKLFEYDKSRWRSFTIWSPVRFRTGFFDFFYNDTGYSADNVFNLLCGATQLESITLNSKDWDKTPVLKLPPADAFGSSGSRLTSLTLYDLDWTVEGEIVVSFPSMKYLYIKSDYGWRDILKNRHNWLKPFPSLEELTLSNEGNISKPYRPNWHKDIGDKGHRGLLFSLPCLKKLRLIGDIPKFVLRALQLPALEILVIQPTVDDDCLGHVAELPFARSAKTLFLQNYSSLTWPNEDISLLCVERVCVLISALNRLSTVILDEIVKLELFMAMKDEIEQVEAMEAAGESGKQMATPSPMLLDGKVAYSLDIPMFKIAIELYKKIMDEDDRILWFGA